MRSRLLGAGLAVGAAAVGGGLGWFAERQALAATAAGRVDAAAEPARAPERTLSTSAADGTPLHVEIHGPDGAPTVVLAHGWAMELRFWRRQLDALAHDLRLVTFDQRGHGRSGVPPGGDFSAEALGSDLAAVLDATVAGGQRCVVVGHSLGGMGTLALCGQRGRWMRERVAGTLLCSTAANQLLRRSAASNRSAALGALEARTLPRLLSQRHRASDLSALLIRAVSLTASADPDDVAFVRELMLSCPPATRSGLLHTLAWLDLSAAVPHVPGPVTVIVGEADRLTPPRQAAVLAAGRTDVEVVRLPGVGHVPPLEAPEAVNGEIRDLVARALAPEAATG